jgi:F-type H+-transporting ATPase subunit gamma
MIVITSDRGLAGGYNVRLLNETVQQIQDKSKTSFITIGRKGRDYLRRRGYNIISEYLAIGDAPAFALAQRIAQEVIHLYETEAVDRVDLCFMRFKSAMTQIPVVQPLLPIVPETGAEERTTEYIYEPSVSEVLDWILPKYLENIIYSALLEAKASEFGAQMTAMESATDNAQEMIEKLVLSYNRARQAAITTEISEIVGGAEALK